MKKVRFILAVSALALGSTTFLTSCGKEDEECAVGYEGKDCKTLSRDKFVGAWKLDETCTEGTDDYTLTIAVGSNGDLSLIMSNVYNDNYTASATVTGTNSIKFNGTAAGGVKFDGTAIYENGGTLKVNYTVTDGTNTNSCNATGTKM
jgi:hypothetical protein